MLPIIQMILEKKKKLKFSSDPTQNKWSSKSAPYAIIVEPTRELCAQVAEQGRKFANGIVLDY